MRRFPPLKALEAFEAAARLNSFREAADELFLTPSAVSHRIQSLERELGVTLFHRVNRAVRLTDAGARYARGIGDAFRTIEATTRDAARTGKSDVLTVHSVPSFATQWLMPRLARFAQIATDIDVRLNASAEPVDLIAGHTDIWIRYGPTLRQDGIVTEPFPDETVVVLASPKLLRAAPIRKPADLARHALIHSEVNLYSWRAWLRDHPGVELNLERGARFDRSFMAIGAAVDGRGVCLESTLLIERELKSRQLVMPLGSDGGRISGHSLNYVAAKLRLPKLRLFREWLTPQLQETAARVGGLDGAGRASRNARRQALPDAERLVVGASGDGH
ncbi:MAG: LysR substrate-binding domain-containing protein [Lautropia sp.]